MNESVVSPLRAPPKIGESSPQRNVQPSIKKLMEYELFIPIVTGIIIIVVIIGVIIFNSYTERNANKKPRKKRPNKKENHNTPNAKTKTILE